VIKLCSRISQGVLLCALCLAVPAGAVASPLLSGYGGPGAGSQVILGSSLVNGPRGGGGGGGGGGSASGGGPTAPAAVTRPPSGGATAPSESAPTRVSRTHRAAGTKQAPARDSTPRTSSTAPGSAARVAPASVQGRAASRSAALGLSSGEVALIIVAACALVAIGFMTGRLARVPRHEGPAA